MFNTRSTSPPKSHVARRVDDVDFGTVVVHGHVFGKDGDTPLTLQIVVVQDEVALVFVFTEQFRTGT